MSKTEMLMRAGTGFVLFSAWVYFSIYPTATDGPIVEFIQLALAGLLGHTANAAKGV
jgi:hypothetical protein